jgi:hypothetical protein
MKTKILIILFLTIGLVSEGQVISGKSTIKRISMKKPKQEVVTLIPDLVITGEKFEDTNKDNFINAGEKCNISLSIDNIGDGLAKGVVIKASVKNEVRGLYVRHAIRLEDINPNSSRQVMIPVEGEIGLEDATAEFFIEVTEERGFDAFPLEMKVETRKFASPNLIVSDAAFSTEDGGLIKLNYPINLKVIVQNIGDGNASEVKVTFSLPNAYCVFLGEQNTFSKENLARGETMELEFLFTATRRYQLPEIPVSIDLSESYGNYAHDTVLRVGLEQKLTARNEVVISGISSVSSDIQIASLSSSVDKNIPVNLTKQPYRYALIIGNEDYVKYQRGLAGEVNVKYARQDASIFKEYAIKTLGVNEMNTYLLLDATAGAISQKIDLVSKLASKTGEQAEIIFYYAGHGLPDEITKVPYLIPVDVSGANLTAAVSLQDIYRKFVQSGAGKVTVFLDACFSGGARDAGLLAARGVKVRPKQNVVSGNLVVFSASSGEQSALPYDEEHHGMFTYFLLKKLQETKGNISYADLSDYVKKNVSIESLRINQKEQDPELMFSPDLEKIWENWNFVIQ